VRDCVNPVIVLSVKLKIYTLHVKLDLKTAKLHYRPENVVPFAG
jgi:hypothetical protein